MPTDPPIPKQKSKAFKYDAIIREKGKPEHKGKVESGVKYCKNNALKGKSFKSLKEQNDYLRTGNSKWADTRIHGPTKQQVKKMFEAEKDELQDLPSTTFEYFKIGIRKVHLDSYIILKCRKHIIRFHLFISANR